MALGILVKLMRWRYIYRERPCATGCWWISRMDSPVRQSIKKPGVHCTEQDIAVSSRLSKPRNVFERPGKTRSDLNTNIINYSLYIFRKRPLYIIILDLLQLDYFSIRLSLWLPERHVARRWPGRQRPYWKIFCPY